jgi:hypothetical protein
VDGIELMGPEYRNAGVAASKLGLPVPSGNEDIATAFLADSRDAVVGGKDLFDLCIQHAKSRKNSRDQSESGAADRRCNFDIGHNFIGCGHGAAT